MTTPTPTGTQLRDDDLAEIEPCTGEWSPHLTILLSQAKSLKRLADMYETSLAGGGS